MSEAEQSREPQQDESTDTKGPRTGKSVAGSGVSAGGTGSEAPGGGGRGADAGTDARSGAAVERRGGAAGATRGEKAAGSGSQDRGSEARSVPRQTGGAAKGGRSGGREGAPGSDSEGRLLSGRYRLGGVLGRGGMGTVWRAVDETLGRTVAVKELRFPSSIDDDEKRRLITRTLREAKAIARIRNNSAVTVYDVVDEDDRPWIVMELVEGKSLAEVIREDGTLTPRRAAEVGLAILDVLRSAHREGILHRDVKPSNVLIADDGRVVLTDFGIAQVEGDPSITSTGMLVGAPSYISPERARGHRPGPAADLWSLGGLIYASVEGCPPYDKGSAIATLTAVMTEPLDPPKNAGPLEEVIYGLLAKDPEQRLNDAGARALLAKVVYAPEGADAPEPPQDATRAMALPPVPPPARAKPKPKPRPKAKETPADRAPGAAAVPPQRAVPQRPEPTPPPVQRAAPVRAPLTDVVPRRTLVVIALVAVLAVVATVVFLTLGDDDDKTENKGAGDDTVATGSAKPGEGGKSPDGATGGSATSNEGADPDSGKSDDKGEKDDADTSSSPSKDKGDEGSKAGKTPKGYASVSSDRFRFSMAMPEKFRMTAVAGANSGGIYSRSGGFPRVQVDFNASPGNDAAAAWNSSMPGVRSTSQNYTHRGIEEIEYKGYPTVADWGFERDQKGKRIRVLNRGFKVDADHGYAIMVSCEADKWSEPECATLRKTAFATFKPKG